MISSNNHRFFIFLTTFLAIVAYIIPWITHPSASFSMGAYDLAEWASLVPSLGTTWMLRLQLVFVTWLIALYNRNNWFSLSWWILTIILATVVLAQLPPIDFFLSAQTDKNYQIQFALAIISTVGILLSLIPQIKRYRYLLTVTVGIAGIITSMIGVNQAIQQLERFNIIVELGFGSSLLILCYLSIIIYTGFAYIANEAA